MALTWCNEFRYRALTATDCVVDEIQGHACIELFTYKLHVYIDIWIDFSLNLIFIDCVFDKNGHSFATLKLLLVCVLISFCGVYIFTCSIRFHHTNAHGFVFLFLFISITLVTARLLLLSLFSVFFFILLLFHLLFIECLFVCLFSFLSLSLSSTLCTVLGDLFHLLILFDVVRSLFVWYFVFVELKSVFFMCKKSNQMLLLPFVIVVIVAKNSY